MTTSCTKPQFTWNELAAVTSGRWWQDTKPDVSGSEGVPGISTDSRSLLPGSMFLALVGVNFDGHDFLGDAITSHAAALLVNNIPEKTARLILERRIRALIVGDTLLAYQQLAAYHRQRFSSLPVVAVTGSSGKTSTKEIIGAILREHFAGPALITENNTNNQIGVPNNLLRLRPEHQAAMLELGTNAPGEIKILTDITHPTIAVLTNVGPVHLKGLGDREGVIIEKSAMFSTLSAHGGWAVVPFSLSRHPRIIAALKDVRLITFGTEPDADVQIIYGEGSLTGSTFRVRLTSQPDLKPLVVQWSLSGAHMALNAGAGIAVAQALGIPLPTVIRALSTCSLPKMRMQIGNVSGIVWINDAYNANPDSMNAFIIWLASTSDCHAPGCQLYVVLGDMLELGDDEIRYHCTLLNTARITLPEATILPVGKRMMRAATELGITGFRDVITLKSALTDMIKPNDVVALKGSRGMALESLLSA
jgi:UDP-N-acetylmuramoyl-tripeptide--D-alanyl-D-alanine ligase